SPGIWRVGVMALAVRLREDYDVQHLCALATAAPAAKTTRRLLALAALSEWGSRGEAARIGGVGIQHFDKLRSAGLGAGVQRGRPGGADRRHGAGSGAAVECRAA